MTVHEVEKIIFKEENAEINWYEHNWWFEFQYACKFEYHHEVKKQDSQRWHAV